ncbi:MAG: NAD-dependent epimerase/dehydratase family protein [Thermoproteota archaeon]|nr:NAD-dependent epimerase/dehydratase family protein [Thermoproteota archaeon]
MRVVITGGAGFIGSHLAGTLAGEEEVTVFDNFSSGRRDFLKDTDVKIILGDIRNFEETKRECGEVDVVYHFAADPDVRRSSKEPLENFRIDVLGTINVLEACRLNDVEQIIFASSSVVYGNAETPTPENAAIAPISNYGAAKAASEHYVSTYSQLYGIRATVLRYANIIGPRLTHGVIYDFFHKLKRNPKELEILGDGNQKKSYLHVNDAVEATLLAAKKNKKVFDVFNVGSEEQITVKSIAGLVVSQLGLDDVNCKYAGGRAGWPGDVPVMLLSIEKLKSLGWKPKFTIEKSVLDTVDWLKTHPVDKNVFF